MEEPTTVTKEHLEKYFLISKQALKKAQEAPVLHQEADTILDMAQRYINDAEHFAKQGNRVLAFAALNYAHGWLDCGAALKYYHVTDNRLFTVDED